VGLNAGMLASIRLGIATDHMNTLWLATRADSEQPVLPTYAHYSLLRGAIESCLDVKWLTDPDVSSKVRVARGVERMLHDLEERGRAEAEIVGIAKLRSDGSDAATRIAEHTAAASAAGITPAGYPGTVELARRYRRCGDGLDTYYLRFLAGILHGTAWAAVRSRNTQKSEIDNELVMVKSEADPLTTWYVTRCGVRAFLAAISSLDAYVGK
jgi:hypothetical protein